MAMVAEQEAGTGWPDDSAVTFRLLAISRAIAGLTDGDAILQALAAEIHHLIPHQHLDIALLGPESQLQHVYEAGMKTLWSRGSSRQRPTARSPIRSVLWGIDPFLLTADAPADDRFHFDGADDEPIFTHNLRSRIHVPLRVQGEVIGAVSISAHRPEAYDETDVACARQCADLIAPYFWALSRGEQARRAAVAEGEARARESLLRQGALRLTEGMERERQRIAMDLHDQTLADLARIARSLARLREEREDRADDPLAAVERDVIACLNDLRGVVEDLKPGVLNLFGFGEAVEALLSGQCAGREGRRWWIDDRTDGAVDRLPDTVRTALYRITQEAVNNAVRHSLGTEIAVTIEVADDGLVIAIRDDGVGLPAGSPCRATGGVGHMKTRAELVGARLSIGPAKGDRGGTLVRVLLPSSAWRPSVTGDAACGS